MGLFNGKNKDGNLKIQMVHILGLPNINDNSIVYMILDSDNKKITFKAVGSKNETTLSTDKITSIGTVSEEIVKEVKGTGRAIAGGLLFGPAGAVVGAVTAKDKKKTIYYKSINYVSNDEEKNIILNTRGDINELKFFRKLNELIPKQEQPSSIDL